MSHAYLAMSNRLRDPRAAKMACDQMLVNGIKALRYETAEEVCKRKNIPYQPRSVEHPACGEYRSWRTDEGTWVGDSRPPPGMKPEDVSFNADFVISLSDEYVAATGKTGAYEIGWVWLDDQTVIDEDTEEKIAIKAGYYPVADYWQQGKGLETVVGPTRIEYETVAVKKDGVLTGEIKQRPKIVESQGRLMQMIRQMEEVMKVTQTADSYQRVELPDGSVVTRKRTPQRVQVRA